MEDTKRLIICQECHSVCSFWLRLIAMKVNNTGTEALREENTWNSFTYVQEHFLFFMRCDQRCGNPNCRSVWICSPIIRCYILGSIWTLELTTSVKETRNLVPARLNFQNVTDNHPKSFSTEQELIWDWHTQWQGSAKNRPARVVMLALLQAKKIGGWAISVDCIFLWLVHDSWLSS